MLYCSVLCFFYKTTLHCPKLYFATILYYTVLPFPARHFTSVIYKTIEHRRALTFDTKLCQTKLYIAVLYKTLRRVSCCVTLFYCQTKLYIAVLYKTLRRVSCCVTLFYHIPLLTLACIMLLNHTIIQNLLDYTFLSTLLCTILVYFSTLYLRHGTEHCRALTSDRSVLWRHRVSSCALLFYTLLFFIPIQHRTALHCTSLLAFLNYTIIFLTTPYYTTLFYIILE